jgi:hypothetical protein
LLRCRANMEGTEQVVCHRPRRRPLENVLWAQFMGEGANLSHEGWTISVQVVWMMAGNHNRIGRLSDVLSSDKEGGHRVRRDITAPYKS